MNLNFLGSKATKIAESLGAGPAEQLPQHMRDLVTALGIPPRLRDIGMQKSDLKEIAQAAMLDNANKTNPRTMTVALYDELLDAAY
jgi:alcohol dehydrogenase class IV